ncbi:hypothetical protein RHSIM_Rhsim12G0040800 [Rhododendron simsii]|uniref:Cyclin-dependent protein kinase inhibitor SMR6 n=1 Tax=Rhododendron simsii TaxID=118357 RepID=A0A834L8R3_RHOSS|nr:hypothetical protein RHSIM_Rhsim12G0040800 [Rhododendron simsii]
MEGGLESEGQKWVVAGIPFGVQLKPVFTSIPAEKRKEDEGEEYCSMTTPTGDEARISTRTECPPPPPRKRKPSSRCHYGGAGEFFNPPDLETVFTHRIERA